MYVSKKTAFFATTAADDDDVGCLVSSWPGNVAAGNKRSPGERRILTGDREALWRAFKKQRPAKKGNSRHTGSEHSRRNPQAASPKF